MVAVEIHRGLMRGGEQGGGNILAAESANHGTGIQGAVAYLQEVVVGLGGEVEELNVGSWEKKKKKKQILLFFEISILEAHNLMEKTG